MEIRRSRPQAKKKANKQTKMCLNFKLHIMINAVDPAIMLIGTCRPALPAPDAWEAHGLKLWSRMPSW